MCSSNVISTSSIGSHPVCHTLWVVFRLQHIEKPNFFVGHMSTDVCAWFAHKNCSRGSCWGCEWRGRESSGRVGILMQMSRHSKFQEACCFWIVCRVGFFHHKFLKKKVSREVPSLGMMLVTTTGVPVAKSQLLKNAYQTQEWSTSWRGTIPRLRNGTHLQFWDVATLKLVLNRGRYFTSPPLLIQGKLRGFHAQALYSRSPLHTFAQ